VASELARGFLYDPQRSPYPGIQSFEAEDAAIYFGRDQETIAVIERLEARRRQGDTRFLIVAGASGSGKSSLLKAGALPQLPRRPKSWIVLPVIRPEKAPIEALAPGLPRIRLRKTLREAVCDRFRQALRRRGHGRGRQAARPPPIRRRRGRNGAAADRPA